MEENDDRPIKKSSAGVFFGSSGDRFCDNVNAVLGTGDRFEWLPEHIILWHRRFRLKERARDR
jgi:hypothetical protein